MDSFLTLLRKDWQLNRVPVFGLALTTVPVCLSYLVLQFWGWFNVIFDDLSRSLLRAAMMSLLLTVVVAAAFGGTAFAEEKRENWGDFLATMPVKRRHIVLSKLTVALGCLLAFCIFNSIIVAACMRRIPEPDAFHGFVDMEVASFAMFGIAWFLSTFLKSTAIAAYVAIVVDALLVATVNVVAIRYSGHSLDEKAIAVAQVVITVATIIAGAAYYIRRVAP